MKYIIIFFVITPIIFVFSAITLSIYMTVINGGIESQTQQNTSNLAQNFYSNASANDIVVNIAENQTITSPITITGRSRGSWFFEATAPVDIVNWDGLIIGQGYIQAQSDWMTENFVEFSGTIEFEKPTYKNNGSIILRADNPSDLPQNNKSIEIPILFSEYIK